MDYIAQDRPLAAEAWFDALVARLDLLRDSPEQGRVVPEWREWTIREVLHSPYRIIHEVHQDRVEILTLSHERQLIQRRNPSGNG